MEGMLLESNGVMHSAKLASGWARKKDKFCLGGGQQKTKYAVKQWCSTGLWSVHKKPEI